MIHRIFSRMFSRLLRPMRRFAGRTPFVFTGISLIAFGLAADGGLPAKKISYDSFHMVRTRNIFDPDRRAMLATTPVAQSVAAPVTHSDYVALNGIMVTSEKSLAFFSGSRAEYSKVLSVKDSIAGASLVKITPDAIVVEINGKQTSVAVGQTIPLDGSAPAPAPMPAPVPDSSSPASPQSSSPGAPADASETMRRMMERRQKELQ